jgi:hypothetical protein
MLIDGHLPYEQRVELLRAAVGHDEPDSGFVGIAVCGQ